MFPVTGFNPMAAALAMPAQQQGAVTPVNDAGDVIDVNSGRKKRLLAAALMNTPRQRIPTPLGGLAEGLQRGYGMALAQKADDADEAREKASAAQLGQMLEKQGIDSSFVNNLDSSQQAAIYGKILESNIDAQTPDMKHMINPVTGELLGINKKTGQASAIDYYGGGQGAPTGDAAGLSAAIDGGGATGALGSVPAPNQNNTPTPPAGLNPAARQKWIEEYNKRNLAQTMPTPTEQLNQDKFYSERDSVKTKAYLGLQGFEQQSKLVTDTIDKALERIGDGYSTGFWAYNNLPESGARELDNLLTTIRSNIGFDKLQQMRDNSPTGGALGQVSEMENRLLQATQGALDPKATDQLRENLQTIRTLYPTVLKQKRDAFTRDYGAIKQDDNIPLAEPATSGGGIKFLGFE